MNEIRIIPVQGIPEIKSGDKLAEITYDVLRKKRGLSPAVWVSHFEVKVSHHQAF